MKHRVLTIAALAFILHACSGGGSSSPGHLTPNIRAHGATTIAFDPPSLVLSGTPSWGGFTYTDSDTTATLANSAVNSTGVVDGLGTLGGVPNYFEVQAAAAGTTSITLTDSDGNTGTLPVTVTSSPLFVEYSPAYFYEKGVTHQFTVTDSASSDIQASSSDTSVVTVGSASSALRHASHAVRRHGARRPHDTFSETFDINAVDFGTATIAFTDGSGNSTQLPVAIAVPQGLVSDPQSVIFSGLNQQLTFQVQEVGDVTFTAASDNDGIVTVLAPTARPRHLHRHNVQVSTQLFTAQSVGIVPICGYSGLITVKDSIGNQMTVGYGIGDVVAVSPSVMNFVQTGASYVQVIDFCEYRYSGAWTVTSSNNAVATVTPEQSNPTEWIVTPVAVPADGKAIQITVKDANGHSTVVPVNVTTTVGGISLERTHR